MELGSEISDVGSSGVQRVSPRGLGGISTEQFLKIMITELQQQDPLAPVDNQQLLQQVSQIRSLEMTSELNESFKSLPLQLNESFRSFLMQQQITSAGAMIGKQVSGLNAVGEQVSGVVASVRVENDEIFLELGDGRQMSMSRVTTIAEPSAGSGV